MRLDKTPLNRNGGLWDRREVDPESSQFQRRVGSLRQAQYAEAPGLAATGGATAELDTAVNFGTILLSVRPGSGAQDRVLLTLTGATDTYTLTLTDETTLTVAVTGGATASDTFTISGDTDIALSKNGNDVTVRDGTSTTTIDATGASDTSFTLSLFGPSSATHRDPTSLTNLHIYNTYQASPSYGSRTQSSADYSFPLQSGESSYQTDSGAVLASDTAAPFYSSGLQFTGRSGAAVIEISPPIYRYYQTAIQAQAETEWCAQFRVTPNKSGTNLTIADFGDLLLLRRTSANRVEATINGTTVTDATSALTSGTEAFISVGQDSSGIRLAVTIGATTVATTGAAVQPPYLSFERIRDLYIGAKEDPSEHWVGSMDFAALHPFWSDDELPDELATFAFRFDDANIPDLDQSLTGLRHYLTPHTTTAGWLGWSGGPIADASHLVLVGGEAAGPVGIAGHQSNLDTLIADGDRSIRLGHQVYGPTWVADLVRKRARSLGVPRPQRKASLTKLSPGVLDAAYGYGIRAVAYDGAAGPVLPIGEVAATKGARVLIGSTSEASGGDTSELGETYLATGHKAVGTEGDQLSATFSSEPTPTVGDNLPVEILASLPDWDKDDYKEEIDMRGAEDVSTSGRSYFRSTLSDIGIDLTTDWCVQAAFRYQSPASLSWDGWEAFPIVGLQPPSTPQAGGTGGNITNASFCAFITEGHDLPTSGEGGSYGTPANPRLVVGFSRQEYDISYMGGPLEADRWHTNYIPITFSSDSNVGWTPGNDYVCYFIRRGRDFICYVNDRTNGTWTTMAARQMDALAAVDTYGPDTRDAIATYTGTNFFSTTNWRPRRTSHRAMFGSLGDRHTRFPLIKSTGQVYQVDGNGAFSNYVDNSHPLIYPAPADAIYWHLRMWERSLSLVDIKADAHFRFAAFPGEPLDTDIRCDFAPVFEDPNETDNERHDAALNMPWEFRNTPTSAATCAHAAQDDSNLQPAVAPFLELNNDGNTLGADGIALYFTELGDGSLVLQVGTDGAYTIPERLWNPQTADAKFTKTVDELRSAGVTLNDWYSDNWFAFDVDIEGGTGSNRIVSVGHLAINGDVPFDTSIGGTASMSGWSTGYGVVHVGGYANSAVKTSTSTRVSEFRWWADGQGPDLRREENFDYLQGRVSENEYTGGTNNLLFYARFQPGDVSGSTVTNLGSAGDFTLRENAEIIDNRSTGGESGAPTVALPAVPPSPDVAAIQIVRTAGIPPVDPDNEDDVQNALEAARGSQMFVLAEVPTGTTHIVDNTPDDALGLPVDRLSGILPYTVQDVATWQGRLVLLDDRNTIYFSTDDNRESFDSSYSIPASGGGDAVALVEVQGERNQSFLLVAGRTWAGMLGGSPDAPVWRSLGPGAGAWSPDSLISYSGMAFMFNGRLWAVANGDAVDIGDPAQEWLPTNSTGSLDVCGDLRSLYITDTGTGVSVRYHFPTQTFSVEDRALRVIGDSPAGVGTIIHAQGTHSLVDAATYADDASGSELLEYSGTLSSQVVTLTATTGLLDGQNYWVKDSAGTIESGSAALSGSTLTFDGLGLADGAVTVYVAPPLILDTGAIDAGAERSIEGIQTEVLAGTSGQWTAAFWASRTPGDLDAVSDTLSHDTLEGRMGSGLRGRFHRIVVRHLGNEDASLSIIEPLTP